MCRVVPQNIEVLVTSAGGVGTTFLSEFISDFRRTNCSYDRDGLKHLPVQPISRNSNLKIFFVVGDPIDQTLSLFRRGYQGTQARRINMSKGLIRRRVQHSTTIEEYAALGRDAMGFGEHLDRWATNPLGYSMMLLKYSAIWDSVEEIYRFLEIPDGTPFPERKERKSTRDGVSNEVLDQLQTTYTDLNRKISAFPDCSVLPNSPRQRNLGRLLASRNLWQLPIESGLFWLRHTYSQFKRASST